MAQYYFGLPRGVALLSGDRFEVIAKPLAKKFDNKARAISFGFAGVPDKTSTDKINDNLDLKHAVQAYLLALPVVSGVGNRAGALHDGY
jgi:hypothetical protein